MSNVTAPRGSCRIVSKGSYTVQFTDSLSAEIVKDDLSLNKVAKLRYEVYIKEQQKSYLEADHEAQEFSDPLDDEGIIVLVSDRAQAVATVRTNHFDHGATLSQFGQMFEIRPFLARWPARSLTTCTRLAVESTRRGSEACKQAFRKIYQYGRESDVRFCFVCCAVSLKPLFTRYGFREYLPPIRHPILGVAARMILLLNDRSHLQACHSPFVDLAPQSDELGTALWFADNYAATCCACRAQSVRQGRCESIDSQR